MATAILNMAKPTITTEFQALLKESNDSLVAIGAVEVPDAVLQDEFRVLIKEIETTIAAEATTDLTVYTTRLQELTAKYDALKARRIKFLADTNPNLYTLADLAKLTYETAMDTALFFLILTAVLLGGSVAANLFIDRSPAYRLYYFIYGAAFFPFTLLYALFNPPYWRSTLFPMVQRGEESSAMSKFPLSLLWNMISYAKPSPLDTETLGYTKGLLSIFIAGLLTTIGVLYFILFRRIPI
jgi:hypothetical protein